MSIKTALEERAAFRNDCRIVADKILVLILDQLELVPEAKQQHVVSMIMTELQIASRKSRPVPVSE